MKKQQFIVMLFFFLISTTGFASIFESPDNIFYVQVVNDTLDTCNLIQHSVCYGTLKSPLPYQVPPSQSSSFYIRDGYLDHSCITLTFQCGSKIISFVSKNLSPIYGEVLYNDSDVNINMNTIEKSYWDEQPGQITWILKSK